MRQFPKTRGRVPRGNGASILSGGKMNRKLLAVAIAGALGVPAAADAQTATIYGRFYPEAVWIRTTGATQPL